MSSSLPIISSGDWQREAQLRDYRAEWLTDMLVERATWTAAAPRRALGALTIGGPSYVWFRFWLAEGERLLEKYFDDSGNPVGMYVHVGMVLPHRSRGFSLLDLILGLWITGDRQVTVHNEAQFEAAVRSGTISPVEAEHAEHQIREITRSIAQQRFPPAIVRNLTVVT
jgi:hypothetical protein